MATVNNNLILGTTGGGLLKYVTGNKYYTICPRISDADSTTETIVAELYDGSSYLSITGATGDIGTGIAVTTAQLYKKITWNANASYPNCEYPGAKVKITATDSSGATSNTASSTFTFDTKNPVFLISDTLTVTSNTDAQVILTWSNTVTETYFSKYEIYYSTSGSTTVMNKDGTLWDDSDDATLATKATVTTTITGLTAGSTYYFALFAKDTAWNYSTPPLIASVTLYNTVVVDGYTRDSDSQIIGNATIFAYRKDTGALVDSTTSDASSGYFTLDCYGTVESFYIVGVKSGMGSGVIDNITVSGTYDLLLNLRTYLHSTKDLTILIGSGEPSVQMEFTEARPSTNVEITKNSGAITQTKPVIGETLIHKTFEKNFVLTFN